MKHPLSFLITSAQDKIGAVFYTIAFVYLLFFEPDQELAFKFVVILLIVLLTVLSIKVMNRINKKTEARLDEISVRLDALEKKSL